jgi:hypothetical protein
MDCFFNIDDCAAIQIDNTLFGRMGRMGTPTNLAGSMCGSGTAGWRYGSGLLTASISAVFLIPSIAASPFTTAGPGSVGIFPSGMNSKKIPKRSFPNAPALFPVPVPAAGLPEPQNGPPDR